MTEPEKGTHKPKRSRSPNYPGIDLGEAIEKTKKLYEKEGKNPAPLSTALGHWGYAQQSGAGLVAVAALKKFGLIDDEGSGGLRRIHLSPLALRIIRDDRPDSRERAEALRKAALTPAIHGELWSEYDGRLPSDENLRYTLKMYKGFTDLGAKEFVRQFRSTVAFAKLAESDMLSGETEDKQDEENEVDTMVSPTSIASGQQRAVQLPISANQWATLQAPFPMSEGAWQQMMTVLGAMKPALVKPEEEVQGDDEEG
jgi:hypothetical protein